MSMPLEGIRVIEWAQAGNGPIMGVQLGWLGADVIKVEDKTRGDMTRGWGVIGGVSMEMTAGRNLAHEHTNRNKRSITIDLKKAKGKEILYHMVEKSDVFFTNFRKSTAAKLGVDYKTLSRYNPKLIYCTNGGFGPKGPDSDKRAFDPLGQARSGLMAAFGEPDADPSLIIGFPMDILGATIGAYGIVTALLVRERFGIGQEVDSSLLTSAMWLNQNNLEAALWLGRTRKKWSRYKGNNPLTNHYKCKDGKWIEICEVQSERFWHEFCQVMGIAELEHDPRFADVQKRSENAVEGVRILDKAFAAKTREEWLKLFDKHKVGFAHSPLNEFADIATDPQVLANDYILDYEHPVVGKVKLVNFPVQFSQTPTAVRREAPECGQHTEEILLEFGYSWEEITELKDEEVV